MDEHPNEPWRDTCVYCDALKKHHMQPELKCLFDVTTFKAMKRHAYEVRRRNQRLKDVLRRAQK